MQVLWCLIMKKHSESTNYEKWKLGDEEDDSYVYYICFFESVFGHINMAKVVVLFEISVAEFIVVSMASFLSSS